MAKTEIAVAELMWNLIAGKTGNVGRVDFTAQKPDFDFTMGEESGDFLPRETPESQGVSSVYLASFLKELSVQKGTDIHQVLIVRHGKVICECGFEPYPAGLWHASYSLCKSIIGMAVGMLVGEGKLDIHDRVIDFFRKKRGPIDALRLKDVTVEHLLTMTSCVNFNETGIVSGNDWVRGFLESGLNGTPGKNFEYNSMNSYMLSAIVTEVTGETLAEYLRPRLWEPLGIRQIFWENCPMGITKGGWGLFLRPEDAAKLGLLYLNRGKWNGIQLIPEEWVEASCTVHAETPSEMSTHGYGYQMWMGCREGSFNYNGMLGQNVVAYPDLDMVVVTNAGSNDLFQNCILMDMVKKYFEADFAPPEILPDDLGVFQALQRTIEELGGRRTGLPVILGGGWKRAKRTRKSAQTGEQLRFLDGKVYEMEEKHVGLMPLMMQVMHNNFTDGIRSIGFRVQEGRLFLDLYEGEELICLEAGFARAKQTWVSFHGEQYLLGVKGDFAADEDGRMVLKLNFAFLEEACRRKVKLHFEEDRLEAQWDETPGKEVILEGLDAFTGSGGRMGFLMNAVKEVGGIDVFHILVERTVQPVCHGKCQN